MFIPTIFHAVNFIESDPDVLINMTSEFQVISVNWIHFEISRAPTPFHGWDNPPTQGRPV